MGDTYAQSEFKIKVDSINFDYQNKLIDDTTHLLNLIKLGERYSTNRLTYWDTILVRSNRIFNLKTEKTVYKIQADIHNKIGKLNIGFGDVQNAENNYLKALEIQKNIKDKNGEAKTLNNLGISSYNKGDISQAIKYLHNSLAISEDIKDSVGVAKAFANIGNLYNAQNNTEKALEYYEKSMLIRKSLNDKKGIANILNNIGTIYYNHNDPNEISNDSGELKELIYYKKALEILYEIEDKPGIASALNNIGSIFLTKANANLSNKQRFVDTAFYYYNKALKIEEEINNKNGISLTFKNLGYAYLSINDINKAEQFGVKSLSFAQETWYPELIKNSSDLLFEIYLQQAKSKTLNNRLKAEYGLKAVKMSTLFHTMKDSLISERIQSTIERQEAKHEYQKQKQLDDAHNEKLLAIEKQLESKQQIVIYVVIFGCILLLGFLVFAYNRLQNTKKQKLIIQKNNQALSIQKDEIISSIKYAEKIQNALLKNNIHTRSHFPENFILFKPKDIVSGDFSWIIEEKGKSKNELYTYVAAVDCTGHGVPGAFLTILGANLLNEINTGNNLLPATILTKLQEKIIKEFSHEEGKNKGGMDISLVRIKSSGNSNKEIVWAGTNNPLYVFRKTSKQIEIINGEIGSIGLTQSVIKFNNHNIDVSSGDELYLFTDGYADQYDKTFSKKIGYSKFRELIIKTSNLDMPQKKNYLEKFFETWKGNESQIDDVCIIGIKL